MALIFDNVFTSYGATLLGIIILTATFINILIFLLGTFLQDDKIKSMARTGFVEIVYSAVIIAFVLVAVGWSQDVAKSLVGDKNGEVNVHVPLKDRYVDVDLCRETGTLLSDNPFSPYYYKNANGVAEGIPYCHIRLAIYYLHTLFNELDMYAFKQYISYLFTSTMADFSINLQYVLEKAGFFTFNPYRGFFVLGNLMKTFAFETAIKIMGVVKFQEVMISYISQALFPGLLMLGVLLRTFAFTRKIGGLLMAIALVLFFVFPMFYAFPGLIVMQVKHDFRDADNPDPGIADYMYAKGTFTTLGKDVDLQKEVEKYKKLREQVENLGPDEFRKKVNSGQILNGDNPGDPSLKDFNLLNGEINPESVSETYKSGSRFLNIVTTTKWYDTDTTAVFDQNGVFDALARLSFFSLFFGILAIIASIASIRSLSVMLGGDVEIAGLTHLI